MPNKHITITIPAAHQSMMQDITSALGIPGMFTAGLFYVRQGQHNSVMGPIEPVGQKVAYISAGSVDENFVQLWLTGPGPVISAAQAAGWQGTSQSFAAAWNEFYTDVSEDAAEIVMDRLGVSTTDPNEVV